MNINFKSSEKAAFYKLGIFIIDWKAVNSRSTGCVGVCWSSHRGSLSVYYVIVGPGLGEKDLEEEFVGESVNCGWQQHLIRLAI